MKLLKRLALVVVVLAFLAVAGVVFFFDPLVKGAIERGGSYAFQVPVTARSVSASPFSGRFEMQGLEIANPAGFAPQPFMSLGTVRTTWDEGTVLSDRIVVDELRLEGLALNLERGADRSNFGVLLDSLDRLSSPASGGGSAPAPSSGGSQSSAQRQVEIRKIVLRDVRATCRVALLGNKAPAAEVAIPEVVVEGFRTDGSTTEIVGAVLRAVVQAALESTLKDGGLPAEFTRDLRGKLDHLRDSVQNRIGSGIEKATQGAGKEIEGALKGASRGIEDLLKKPK